MTAISREEVAHLARLSRLAVSDEELDRIYTIISSGTAATQSPTDEPAAQSPIAIQPASEEVRP